MPRPLNFSCHVEGAAELVQWMRKIPLKLKRKVLRDAVREALKPVRSAAKAKAPIRWGYLKRSLGLKVKTYPSGNVVGLTGPRSNFRVPDPRGGQTKSGKPKSIRPAWYAHLVEGGTKRARAKPFLGPAADANMNVAASIMVAKVKAAVEGG